jgi:hypothetical protein
MPWRHMAEWSVPLLFVSLETTGYRGRTHYLETYRWYVEFEVITAVTMKRTIFCDVTPRSPIEIHNKPNGQPGRWKQNRLRTPNAACQFIPGETAPGNHWIGGWVGPRAGSDVAERRPLLTDCLFYSLVLEMEAVHSSESSLNFYQTTRRHVTKYSTFQ